MAIGSPDKAARLDQLRVYADVQVRSGFRAAAEVRSDVFEAVRDEVQDPAEAQRLTDEFVSAAHASLAAEAAGWPEVTEYDRLQAAFAGLRAGGVVVLEAVDDHWAANEKLDEMRATGRQPRGIAYFTHTDIWHAVEHRMLELNLWHGTSANVAEGDDLLGFVTDTLAAHGIESVFDEGRIEVSVAWQRRPFAASH